MSTGNEGYVTEGRLSYSKLEYFLLHINERSSPQKLVPQKRYHCLSLTISVSSILVVDVNFTFNPQIGATNQTVEITKTSLTGISDESNFT